MVEKVQFSSIKCQAKQFDDDTRTQSAFWEFVNIPVAESEKGGSRRIGSDHIIS